MGDKKLIDNNAEDYDDGPSVKYKISPVPLWEKTSSILEVEFSDGYFQVWDSNENLLALADAIKEKLSGGTKQS